MSGTLVFVILVAGAPALKEPTRNPLLGKWECTSLTLRGIARPPDKCVWDFAASGKLYRHYGDPPPAKYDYTTDPAKKPARLDFTDRGGQDTIEAIYMIEEDTLTLCFSNRADDARPTRFESPAGSHLRRLTFRRVGPKD